MPAAKVPAWYTVLSTVTCMTDNSKPCPLHLRMLGYSRRGLPHLKRSGGEKGASCHLLTSRLTRKSPWGLPDPRKVVIGLLSFLPGHGDTIWNGHTSVTFHATQPFGRLPLQASSNWSGTKGLGDCRAGTRVYVQRLSQHFKEVRWWLFIRHWCQLLPTNHLLPFNWKQWAHAWKKGRKKP